METILKDAVFSDHQAIADLHANSWRKHYRGMYSDAFLDNDVYRNRLEAWKERLGNPAPNQQVVIAMHDGILAGFACIFTGDDPVFGTLLDNLHVSSSVQKAGIGTLLIREAARRSYKKDNNSPLYLWVLEPNSNARRFYENLGAVNHETIEKENIDGSFSRVCRYTWSSCRPLLDKGR